jgi:hypothetical protein
MRFSVLALALVVTATTALDAQGQLLGRRRRARDCCAQVAPAPAACCTPVAYGQTYPQMLPATGTSAMVMPMPQTTPSGITPVAGVQTPGDQPVTPATTTAPQPQPVQPTAPLGYSVLPGIAPGAYGSGCCCETVAYADGGNRRRGLFRRY